MTTSSTHMILELMKIHRPEFVSFTYTAKGTGERARHLLNVGFNMVALYQRDIQILEDILDGLGALQRAAALAILKTRRVSLDVGIGHNPNYTCEGVYSAVGGLKVHVDTGEVHVHGLSVKKKVLERGEYHTVNSAPLTLAKKELMSGLPSGKLRQFNLGHMEQARLHGKTLVLVK